MIFIFMPVILCVFLFIFGYRFPIMEKEFNIVKKEISRRRGEDSSSATPEEIRVCERVTGISYDKLWNSRNQWVGHGPHAEEVD